MSAEEEDPVVALAALVERLERESAEKHHKADQQLRHLATTTIMLGRKLDKLARKAKEKEDRPPSVISWLELPKDAEPNADPMLQDLARWLFDVYQWWPDTELTGCWLWHPAVVEELLSLRYFHAAAYHGEDATAGKAMEFLERWRPGVVKRVNAMLQHCWLDEVRHRDPTSGRVVPLAAHVSLVAGAWRDRREPPVPTAEALADADRHERERFPRGDAGARS
jgi:hypothetical protein